MIRRLCAKEGTPRRQQNCRIHHQRSFSQPFRKIHGFSWILQSEPSSNGWSFTKALKTLNMPKKSFQNTLFPKSLNMTIFCQSALCPKPEPSEGRNPTTAPKSSNLPPMLLYRSHFGGPLEFAGSASMGFEKSILDRPISFLKANSQDPCT